MTAPGGLIFEKLVDDFSYQVFTAADPRFWFRLEREARRDVITDYFLGSLPKEQSGRLLADCYRFLGLTPRNVLVFRDILSGRETDEAALNEARHLYAQAGTHLLTHSSSIAIEEEITQERGKWNLILSASYRN